MPIKRGSQIVSPPGISSVYWGNFLVYQAMQLVTVTGVSPLILVNALAKPIKSLTQYGKVEQRNLPHGYTELDYIQSNGSQYIDTVISLVDSDTITVDGCAAQTGSQFLFSQGQSSDNQAFQLANTTGVGNAGIVFDIQNYTPYRVYTGVDANGTMRHIEIINREIFVDGVSCGTSEGSVTVPTSTARLFCNASGVCYYTRIRRFAVAGKIDLRAAKRNSDNEVGLYDLVSGQFFTNAGTGSFTAGPDATPAPDRPMDLWTNNGVLKARRQSGLPLAYQMVEWLKPTNAIPITGFKTKSTQEITTVFYRESSGSSYLYWSDTSGSGTTSTTAYLTTGGGNWRWDGKTLAPYVATQTKMTSVQSADGLFFNGTKWGSYTNAEEFVSTNDLSLSSYTNTSVRIYSMTIREGETVTLDLVPVQRVLDGVYGFYDKVSGNFYTNDEATFTAGDPIDDPVEIYTNGEDEVLTVRGINLLDPSTSNITIGESVSSDGSPAVGLNNWRTDYIPIVGGKTYAFWGIKKEGNTISAYNRINWYTADKVHILPRPSYTIKTVTIATAPSNAAYAILSCAPYNSSAAITRDTFDEFNWTFAEGSAEIPYEPYVQPQTVTVPMLLGAGNYKDKVELIRGIKTGRIGVKVLDGTEDWQRGSTSDRPFYLSASIDDSYALPNTPFCTHFQGVASTVTSLDMPDFTIRCGYLGYERFLYIKYKDLYSGGVNAFKDYLAAQYAAGTPVIVVYPLADETTEQVTGQALNASANTTIITSVSMVDLIELSAQYYSI